MSTLPIAAVVLACLLAAVVGGRLLARALPIHLWSTGTQDTVKLALGLVATMAAVMLGLLVSSSKDSYDQQKRQIVEMGAKVAVIDRLLGIYGDETAPLRAELRTMVQSAVERAWPTPGQATSVLAVDPNAGASVFQLLGQLEPKTAFQTDLKSRLTGLSLDIAERRALLVAQSAGTEPTQLLGVAVGWLVVILFGFSLLAPRSHIALGALLVAAVSVCGAIVLLLELRHPFDGLFRVPSDPITQALGLPKH
jgi:type II secretory pathway pseudopilin PulG